MDYSTSNSEYTILDHSNTWQAWGLIKQELLFLCWALMEVAIIAPFALIVMRWAQFWATGQITLWILLLVLLPFNLVRLLSSLGTTRKFQWRIVFAVLIMVLLITWRGLLYSPRPLLDLGWLGEFSGYLGDLGNPLWARDFTIFLFVLLAWWRGLRLAQLTPDIYRIGFRLRAGVLVLTPLALILHSSGRLLGATPYILLYFLAGLTAVALIRAEQIERERSGFAASLTPTWVLTIFAVSLLVVMTAGSIAAIISGDASSVITGYLAPVWVAILATAAVSLSTLVFLLTPAMNLLSLSVAWLSDLFSRIFSNIGLRLGSDETIDLDILPIYDLLIRGENPFSLDLPPFASQSLTVFLMLGVAALIVYFLTRLFRQPPISSRLGTDPSGSSASTESPTSIGERILQRLGLMRRWRTAASIRHIYTSMCRAASGVGYPRVPAETPYEYLITLARVWPENQEDSILITDAYVRVRYGEIPETASDLEEIKAAWQRLSASQPERETPTPTAGHQHG